MASTFQSDELPPTTEASIVFATATSVIPQSGGTFPAASTTTPIDTSTISIGTQTSLTPTSTSTAKSHALSSGAYIGIGIGVGIGILVILILLFAFLRRKIQISWKSSKPPAYEAQTQAMDHGPDEGKAELASNSVGLARGKEELDTSANRHEALGREVRDVKTASVSEAVLELPADPPAQRKKLVKGK